MEASYKSRVAAMEAELRQLRLQQGYDEKQVVSATQTIQQLVHENVDLRLDRLLQLQLYSYTRLLEYNMLLITTCCQAEGRTT